MTNEFVAKTSPMRTHYHSNPAENGFETKENKNY